MPIFHSSTTHTLPDSDGLYVRLKTRCGKQDGMRHTLLLEHKIYVPGSNSPSPIASSTSFVIHKDRIVLLDDWYDVMDSHDDEMLEFATELFTERAKLHRKWIGSTDKGTGVWGHELDHGSILYIQNIFVDSDYRGRGVGTWLLRQILTSEHVASCRFAYAWPTAFEPTFRTKAELIAIGESVVKIFAKIGFRRIGRSNFVCYALMDTNHPSRSLPSSGDAEPLIPPLPGELHEDGIRDFRDLVVEEARMRPDAPFRIQTALRSGRGQALFDHIRQQHAADPSCIRVKDHQGMTPLHVAAFRGRPTTDRRYSGSALVTICRRKTMMDVSPWIIWMRKWREFGSSKKARSLRGMMTRCASASGDALAANARVRGLVREWRFASKIALERRQVALWKRCTPGRFLPAEIVNKINMIEYVSHPVRSQPIDQPFIFGYSACYTAVSAVLERGDVPTVPAVSQELDCMVNDSEGQYSFASHYFEMGGRLEFVLNGVAYRSWEEGLAKQNTFDDAFAKEIQAMPVCANDDAYGIVRINLHIRPEFNGPDRGDRGYDEDPETYEEDEEDDDEDELPFFMMEDMMLGNMDYSRSVKGRRS